MIIEQVNYAVNEYYTSGNKTTTENLQNSSSRATHYHCLGCDFFMMFATVSLSTHIVFVYAHSTRYITLRVYSKFLVRSHDNMPNIRCEQRTVFVDSHIEIMIDFRDWKRVHERSITPNADTD